MKVNKFILSLLIVLILIAVAGCGGEVDKQNADTSADKQTTSNAAAAEAVAVPEEKPDSVVKVKEIVGNEVTAYKMQSPPNDQQPGGSNNQNPASQKTDSSAGETETFIIPVGTPIVAMQKGANTTVALTDLKKDQTLRIWKKDGVITFVQVMGGGAKSSSDQSKEKAAGNMPPDMGGPPPGSTGGKN